MYSQTYKRYVTVLLLVTYIFNHADRAVFGLLMEPIKRELDLSDTQLGFLAGPSLVVFYALLGIPVARLADRQSRVVIMSIAVALWSTIVSLSAAVGNVWQLALARVGVGVGEAGFSAVAQSLITDYHSAVERTRAISIFMLAIPLGSVVSNLVGGWVSQAFGWRAAFIAVGLPGLVLAFLIRKTVSETRQDRLVSFQPVAVEKPPLKAVFARVWRSHALRHLAIAQAVANTLTSSILGWMPTFFIRNHGIPSGELGTWLAIIGGAGGSAGIWLGGYVTNRFGANDARIRVRLMSAIVALVPATVLICLWSDYKPLALLMLLPSQILLMFFFGPTYALVQALSAQNMRATVTSIFILVQVLAGGLIGVQLLGVLSDAITPAAGGNAPALRWSMTLFLLMAFWAAAHFWLAGRSIRQELSDESPRADIVADARPAR